MKVLVTGATGFLGHALTLDLVAAGHEVSALSRSAEANGRLPATVHVAPWSPLDEAAPISAIEGVDAIVHFAGEPINDTWTRSKRQAILDSWVTGTRNLLLGIAAAGTRPGHLVCASAIGYYGDRGDELLDENVAPGDGFLADVCRQWEAKPARRASWPGRENRTIRHRSRSRRRCACAPPADDQARGRRPARLGQPVVVVDPSRRRRQSDRAYSRDQARRPLNIAAPEPVRRRDLAHALGRALHRPAVLPTPAFMLRAVLDSFAAELLSSRRVSAGRLIRRRFEHRFGNLDTALADLTRN